MTTILFADNGDSKLMSGRIGFPGLATKDLVNGVVCMICGIVDIFIAWYACDPSFPYFLYCISPISVCFVFTAIFPCYSQLYHPFVLLLGDIYDGGVIKKTHPSYISEVKRKPIIICGDLNVAANPIDLKNPGANQNSAGYSPQERAKFQELLSAGFVDTYRELYPDKVEYSWWSYRFKSRERNAGWRIDYFLLSEFAKDKIIDAKIHTDIMGSDHCPVSLEIDI